MMKSLACAILCSVQLKTILAFQPTSSHIPTASAAKRNFARRPASASVKLWSAAAAANPAEQGWFKTVNSAGTGEAVNNGDICTVKYSCYLLDDSNTLLARSESQKFVVGDGNMIPGWDLALSSMRVGELSVVRITDSNLAYGTTGGIPPLIPSNAQLEMTVQILDRQPATANIDFDSLVSLENSMIPQTAAEIDAAYQKRQALRANEVELEGLEYWIAKFKSYYFFGLFEGETGERAPWFLRPSITFPLAFAIVGLTFYISFVGGAISERGAQIKDELDEVILSYNSDGGNTNMYDGTASSSMLASTSVSNKEWLAASASVQQETS